MLQLWVCFTCDLWVLLNSFIKSLEPYYSDYRKLRLNTPEGWKIIHMDEYVDELLEKEMAFNINLPFLTSRKVLELRGDLPPRKSILDDEFDGMVAELEKEDSVDDKRVKISNLDVCWNKILYVLDNALIRICR